MANVLSFEKVTTLPGTFTPSTLYLVKTGTGFDLHVSSADGAAVFDLNLPAGTAVTQYVNSIVAGTLQLVTGVNRWYAPTTIAFTRLEMFVSTPATGADIIINVNKNGTSVGSYTLPAGTYYHDIGVINIAVAAGDYLTYDITQIGSSTPGSDLQIRLSY